jgi:hypothetical protein
MIREGGLVMLPALGFEKKRQPDRFYSVLNKVNTNHILKKRLTELTGFTGPDLLDYLKENPSDFFSEHGRYFPEVYRIIRAVESKGEKLEQLASLHLIELYKIKYDITPDVRREETGSYRDMKLGIDLSLTHNGKEVTFQVKPLVSFKEENDVDVIRTKGQVKIYDTDYMTFVSGSTKEVVVYRNSGVVTNRYRKEYKFKKETKI